MDDRDTNEDRDEHDTNKREDEHNTNADERDTDEDERLMDVDERVTNTDERNMDEDEPVMNTDEDEHVRNVDERDTDEDEHVTNRDERDTNRDEHVTNEEDEDEDEDHMDEDDTSETKTETEDGDNRIEESEVKDLADEAGEIEAGEDEYWGGSEHRQRMEYGQGVEDYEDRGDEIGDGPNNPVIARAQAREQRARTEAKEQRARAEAKERARAEAWEQPYHAGRTHSTATPAKSGGKVQQLVKIPAIGSGHLGSALLPPSKMRTKASVSKAGIVVTGGLEPDSSSQSIPLDRNAIIKHYAESSPYKKRGHSASPESQPNKSQRISVSHSSAISRNPSPSGVPSTKLSTRDPSPSPVPSVVHDPQGSSRTTGGLFGGKALGSAFRFADAGKLMPMLMPA
jgi:hypothetical protein